MKALLARLLARYTVVVNWEGVSITHLARSLPDAREWAACYPHGADVSTFRNLNGMLIERRGYA